MENGLINKVALITGASSGIGEATAREFARRGAVVAVAARSGQRLRELAREIELAGGRARVVEVDLADEEAVRQAVDELGEELGRIDILVNNAGIGLSGRVAELRTADLRRVMEVNVVGPVVCTQAALRYMSAAGRVINVSSVVGRRAVPNVGGYCASKAALGALSDALRVEVADSGIGVTSVYPGTTRTAFSKNSLRTRDEKRGWRPRGVGPERVASAIADAAQKGGRDVYVTLTDRVFVAATIAAPRLFDRILRRWARS